MQAKCLFFKKKLTAEYLERIKSDNDLQVSDTEVPGLHLHHSTQTGHKVFYLHYTLRLDGTRKERNLKLGRFPEISAPDTRANAIKFRRQVLEDIDPMFECQEHLHKAMGEQEKQIPLKVVMEKYLEKSIPNYLKSPALPSASSSLPASM